MINVYCLDISQISDEHYKTFYAAASGERQKKADRCRFPADAKRCILADILLRYGAFHFQEKVSYFMLKENLLDAKMQNEKFQNTGTEEMNCSKKILELQIAQGPNGKPYVENLDGFHYNLSHSGDWVVLAWGDSEVGVDVEQLRESANLERITRRFFTEEERTYIFAPVEEQERNRRFTKIWTCKESYVKYLGTGLAKSLESFSVDGEHDRVRLVDEEPLMLKSWQLGEKYFLSLCCGQDEVLLKELFWKELLNFL